MHICRYSFYVAESKHPKVTLYSILQIIKVAISLVMQKLNFSVWLFLDDIIFS